MPEINFLKINRIYPFPYIALCLVFFYSDCPACEHKRPHLTWKSNRLLPVQSTISSAISANVRQSPGTHRPVYLGLEIDTINRMPKAAEVATVILIDTHHDNKILRVDKTYAWNPQQGTMFYWHPLAAETMFFFNDRDIKTGKIFTVLYDLDKKQRIRVSMG